MSALKSQKKIASSYFIALGSTHTKLSLFLHIYAFHHHHHHKKMNPYVTFLSIFCFLSELLRVSCQFPEVGSVSRQQSSQGIAGDNEHQLTSRKIPFHLLD